jgi:hypothetical protein
MYSYDMANKCFEENKRRLGVPDTDPEAWNLNTGLANLTGAIEGDLSEIKQLLRQIASALARPR